MNAAEGCPIPGVDAESPDAAGIPDDNPPPAPTPGALPRPDVNDDNGFPDPRPPIPPDAGIPPNPPVGIPPPPKPVERTGGDEVGAGDNGAPG
ncbi:hypothetical protein [Mycobacterium paragordonae]|uniref:hypothetical protein n=1 Tax=Mycobacterium paragordonae TaxID=1389713 RepID=UPI00105D7F63|nr:hypothetical protein [Mycobacterium paragordonae]TDL02923.1 hypothetical protein EUA05_25850 [Mycobacterium paragordonae]